jgi:hypothetical protein
VLHRPEHPSFAQERVVEQFVGVEHCAGRDAGRAERVHHLALRSLARPRQNDLIHGCLVAHTVRVAREAWVVNQVFAANHRQKSMPVMIPSARRIDETVVVRPTALALIHLAGRVGTELALVPQTLGWLIREGLAGVGNAAEVDHRLLHGDLDPLAAPGDIPMVERGQDPDRGVQPRARVADVDAWLERSPVALAGRAERPADGLGDHVEREKLAKWTFRCEAFDLRIDDARIDPGHLVVPEPETLDDARSEVLHEYVAVLDQAAQQRLAALVLQIARHAPFVGVEEHEVVRVDAGLVGRGMTSLLAMERLFDLDHVGAEPCEGLRARRAGFELREVDNPHIR